MDIDLLSKMVKELILDNDRVVLPGLGTFVAEVVPAVFSDRGYTINPPYRRLHFRTGNERDDALATLYAEVNGVEKSVAVRVIEDFIAEMKEVVAQRKVVVFPGLGRLRATKENNLFFVADAGLDIYPEGFGLEPVSLKTHQETPEEVTEAVVDLAGFLDDVPSVLPPEPANPAPKPADPASELDIQAPEPACIKSEPEASISETSEIDAIEPETPESEIIIPEEPLVHVIEPVDDDNQAEGNAGNVVVEAESGDLDASEQKSPVAGKKRRRWKIFLIVTLSFILAAALSLAIFLLLAEYAPDFIDSILYTPEELEILHW
ncbi:MAG: hypothetical protein ACI4TM_03020 [Candidatus Cryptobacteroides sp.]